MLRHHISNSPESPFPVLPAPVPRSSFLYANPIPQVDLRHCFLIIGCVAAVNDFLHGSSYGSFDHRIFSRIAARCLSHRSLDLHLQVFGLFPSCTSTPGCPCWSACLDALRQATSFSPPSLA